MRQELEQKLFNSFPHLYRERFLPMTMTCMCWGIDVSDGWYDILFELSNNIQNYLNSKKKEEKFYIIKKLLRKLLFDSQGIPTYLFNILPSPIFSFLDRITFSFHDSFAVNQVKEKYGGLRYYVNLYDSVIESLIGYAEYKSLNTCELCGEYGVINKSGWLSVRCDKCRKKEK